MRLDILASERHFLDHLVPVWEALGRKPRVLVVDSLQGAAHSRGIPASWPPPDLEAPVLVASYGDLKRARKFGYKRIALMEHGYGQSFSDDNPSYAGGRDRDDVGLFLVPNEHAAQRNRHRNPGARVEVVGCPKLDTLPPKEEGPLTIAVSFHWDCYFVPEAASAFEHFRTAIPALAKRYNVIGHGHPRSFTGPPMLGKRYRRMEIPVVLDFADVCRQADLYVCDYSSTIYEFASTGRPVVVMNSPHYRRNVNHGLRYWEAADVGIQVDDPGELVRAVTRALVDGPRRRAARENALDMVYTHRFGAAQRAADVLSAWA